MGEREGEKGSIHGGSKIGDREEKGRRRSAWKWRGEGGREMGDGELESRDGRNKLTSLVREESDMFA